MRKSIYSILISLFLFVSCKKDEIPYFQGKDAMTIYVNQYEADSTSYSFAYSLPEVKRDTVYVKVRTQGLPSTIDRNVELFATEGTTAIEGDDFILPVFILPAGEVEALYPVILLRSEILKEEVKKLLVSVKANSYFAKGGLGQEIGGTYSIPQFTINFSDFLSKPAYWSSIERFVGEYSATKLQFMMTVYVGVTDFSTLSSGEKRNMTLRMRRALAEYEEINQKPLMDENNKPVTF